MSSGRSTCELEQYEVTNVRFLHIEPRPSRSGAPSDVEQELLELLKKDLERERHDCPEGCDCVIGEPVEVASREQIKKVSNGTYTAWYEVTLVKYRTQGECMPKGDKLPESARQ